ncbi:MAG: hypothetical protein L6R00_19145 [Phycisphaerae bacterium]|nr:hypothetical protein [Phycisphaerae bacterium]
MSGPAFRFEFSCHVSLLEAEQTLHLAQYAAEGLYGGARVRLHSSYRRDEAARCITVDAGDEVGAAIAKVYTGLLLREFGEDAFSVRPVQSDAPVAVGCQA